MFCYRLAPHVLTCQTADQVVLLDVRRNQYLGLGAPEAIALGALIEEWPAVGEPESRAAVEHDTDVSAITAEMLDAGLITKEPVTRDISLEAKLPRPIVPLIDGYVRVQANVAVHDIRQFARAFLVGSYHRRNWNLQAIVSRLGKRRQSRSSDHAVDIEALTRLVVSFNRIRRFFYSAHQQCLFDSLVLVEFLSGYGMFPRWVIGVQTNPFSAHCWVQSHDLVLNDSVEHVLSFTPILAV